MPPNAAVYTNNTDRKDQTNKDETVSRDYLRKRRAGDQWNCYEHILWMNVFWFTLLHVASAYAIYLVWSEAKVLTTLFAILVFNISIFGVTAGVHRLWSHRAFKAKLPLRIMLGFFNSIAYQNSIYEWARDHRVHHKYSETNADPVNIERGFFFAHVGWLLCKKHPDVYEFGRRVDMSDLLRDPVVYYQKKYYIPSVVLMCFFLPTYIPCHFWSESVWNAFLIAVILRYTLALNATWLVNSAAHMFGDRPYDVNIAPSENKLVAFFTLGEGWHNYHHTFPWDYSTSEWGWNINFTTLVLDQLAKIGLVYDRRYATKEMISARQQRTGKQSKHYQPSELGY